MDEPDWSLSDDRRTVTVRFPTNSESLELDATALEKMQAKLGELRALMIPPIHPDWAMGQKVVVRPNPRWVSEPDVMRGDSLLHIRDDRFGWLHYLIPREAAAKLAGFLQTQVDSPPPGQQSGKPH